jgi:hypothetical protein
VNRESEYVALCHIVTAIGSLLAFLITVIAVCTIVALPPKVDSQHVERMLYMQTTGLCAHKWKSTMRDISVCCVCGMVLQGKSDGSWYVVVPSDKGVEREQ